MKQKGFTLIELLVVIAIIGLLASVVLVSLNGARQKARVARRVADLKQITTALELYYNDNNSQYPPARFGDNPGGNWRTMCGSWFVPASASNVIPGLVPTYMSAIPTDPLMTQPNQNCYLYTSSGTDYKLLDYNLTDMTLAQINQYPTYKDPTRNDQWDPCKNGDTNLSMAIFSPGGRCW